MTYLPTASDLLEEARRTLLDDVLPIVPTHATYPLRMIANAMAIAGRELAIEEASPSPPVLVPLEGVPAVELCVGIREGVYDAGAGRAMLVRRLERDIRQALSISNPKALRL